MHVKYSRSFIEKINFFYQLNRSGLITFCGSKIDVVPDIDSPNGLQTLKSYDNGVYSKRDIKTRHPNFVHSVILGKKGWGLWIKQWSQGIGEGTFTKFEILKEFEDRNIKIPKPLMEDFNNNISRERWKYCKL